MTIIWQKWQPIWHQLTHFQTKDNATQNLYLQALNSSHRPIRKFIIVFKRLVFCIQCTPLQNPAEYLAAIWSLQHTKVPDCLFGISSVRMNPIRWKTVLEKLQVIILNTSDIFFNKCSQTK